MRRLVLTVLVFLAVGLLPMLCHRLLRGHMPRSTKTSQCEGPIPCEGFARLSARNFPQ